MSSVSTLTLEAIQLFGQHQPTHIFFEYGQSFYWSIIQTLSIASAIELAQLDYYCH